MRDAEFLELGHVTIFLLALGEVPLSKAADCMVLYVSRLEVDIAPDELMDLHAPDHVVGLGKINHFLRSKAELQTADLHAYVVDLACRVVDAVVAGA